MTSNQTNQPRQTEHEAQCAVIAWARWKSARWPMLRWLYANTNGAKLPYRRDARGKRFSAEAVRLINEGLTAGVSDLFLPFPNGSFCGLYIEMKVGRNKPTAEQACFTRDMNAYGYRAVTCWGADAAIACIADYLDMPADERW